MPGDHIAVFYEMVVILAIARTAGIVGGLLKQPLLIAFIAAGIDARQDIKSEPLTDRTSLRK